ncbi:Histone deacetylase 8 [Coemansia sp. Benny D115]|nr:Histone deacetylase 8 [Coemansia sp. Benny D115]
MPMPSPPVLLVRSPKSIVAGDNLPPNFNRASLVHALIDAFHIPNLEIVAPEPATASDLAAYHTPAYTEALLRVYDSDTVYESPYNSDGMEDDDEEFGLVDDCMRFFNLDQYVRYTAGGTLKAAQVLVDGDARVVLHWEGGRHHAGAGMASGFCYVNDVVLGILRLQQRFSRILYVDLDLHHGDGVENAFAHSARVTTLSIHHCSPWFYPGTGTTLVDGKGRGVGRSINVPLEQGATDASFTLAFELVFESVFDLVRPDAVVVQCGCDGLSTDPIKKFNTTPVAYVNCLRRINSWGLPLMVLGGGGYSSTDSAICWTQVTAALCGYNIPPETDIPEHEFYTEYAPSYNMTIEASLQEDLNTEEQIREMAEEIRETLAELSAP